MLEAACRPPADSPEVGPFRRSFWRSPLRGPWLASLLSSALLPLIVDLRRSPGLLSHARLRPGPGPRTAVFGPATAFDLYFFDWPTSPAWLYALTQGLHVVCGLAADPDPAGQALGGHPEAVREPARARRWRTRSSALSLALLVGGSLFVFATGRPQHPALVPVRLPVRAGALLRRVASSSPRWRSTSATQGRRGARGLPRAGRPARRCATTWSTPRPSPACTGWRPAPRRARRRRRSPAAALLGTVGCRLAGRSALMGAGQVVGGPLRELALLAPRGRACGAGPNDFQVNKTFARRGHTADAGRRRLAADAARGRRARGAS